MKAYGRLPDKMEKNYDPHGQLATLSRGEDSSEQAMQGNSTQGPATLESTQ